MSSGVGFAGLVGNLLSVVILSRLDQTNIHRDAVLVSGSFMLDSFENRILLLYYLSNNTNRSFLFDGPLFQMHLGAL